jgi:hypothetical protein
MIAFTEASGVAGAPDAALRGDVKGSGLSIVRERSLKKFVG